MAATAGTSRSLAVAGRPAARRVFRHAAAPAVTSGDHRRPHSADTLRLPQRPCGGARAGRKDALFLEKGPGSPRQHPAQPGATGPRSTRGGAPDDARGPAPAAAPVSARNMQRRAEEAQMRCRRKQQPVHPTSGTPQQQAVPALRSNRCGRARGRPAVGDGGQSISMPGVPGGAPQGGERGQRRQGHPRQCSRVSLQTLRTGVAFHVVGQCRGASAGPRHRRSLRGARGDAPVSPR
ncbi:uncharacterized protein LOC144107208 [Amblyomma americanum]